MRTRMAADDAANRRSLDNTARYSFALQAQISSGACSQCTGIDSKRRQPDLSGAERSNLPYPIAATTGEETAAQLTGGSCKAHQECPAGTEAVDQDGTPLGFCLSPDDFH